MKVQLILMLILTPSLLLYLSCFLSVSIPPFLFFFFTVPPAIGHHMCVSTGDIASDLSTSRCLNCAREHPWAYARWDFSLCGLWPGGLRALLNPKEVKKEKKRQRKDGKLPRISNRIRTTGGAAVAVSTCTGKSNPHLWWGHSEAASAWRWEQMHMVKHPLVKHPSAHRGKLACSAKPLEWRL